jgi:DNA-binding PadR family transcriptional regulator
MTLPTVGELELAVLLTVARLAGEAYGASVRRELVARTGRDHALGAIYTTLQRIENKGLVVSSMSEPAAVRGGRARRCFRITALGSRVIRDAHNVRSALWKGIPTWSTA